MSDGLIDTNLFIHAQTTDRFSDECRAFLGALASGQIRARLEPLILHELSYVLPRYVKQMTRRDVAAYLAMVIGWEGVQCDRHVLGDAVQRWRDTAGLSFADAYLTALATQLGCAVYTKNVREVAGQRVATPDPLPSGA